MIARGRLRPLVIGKQMKQKTIQNEIHFSGTALQTGKVVNVICESAGENEGIIFIREDLSEAKPLKLKEAIFSSDKERRSTVGCGARGVQTVEHFLASLWALEIDNLIVKIDGEELPGLDGSAVDFLNTLNSAGIVEQETARNFIKIDEEIKIEEAGKSISIKPSDKFEVKYTIDYNIDCIKNETIDMVMEKNVFIGEIAPARTFCLKEEAEALLKAGLGRGANYENTLVLDSTGPIGTEMRFPNEPIRHKILDLVGDLYMLGMPIIGKVEAIKTGHSMNLRLVKEIYNRYVANHLSS